MLVSDYALPHHLKTAISVIHFDTILAMLVVKVPLHLGAYDVLTVELWAITSINAASFLGLGRRVQ